MYLVFFGMPLAVLSVIASGAIFRKLFGKISAWVYWLACAIFSFIWMFCTFMASATILQYGYLDDFVVSESSQEAFLGTTIALLPICVSVCIRIYRSYCQSRL